MHPQIKKFWRDAGYRVEKNDITGTIYGYKGLPGGPISISKIETLAFGNRHRFNGIWYSEEEMLRIIRLKAFI
jgi:hypothetical protein